MFKLLAKFQTISMKMSDDELVVTTALIQRLMGNFLKLEGSVVTSSKRKYWSSLHIAPV